MRGFKAPSSERAWRTTVAAGPRTRRLGRTAPPLFDARTTRRGAHCGPTVDTPDRLIPLGPDRLIPLGRAVPPARGKRADPDAAPAPGWAPNAEFSGAALGRFAA
ncbi:hypothetical protein ABZU94_39440 [Streptomyces mirabilis]|uniref:hypothetical protein n=1 Tax=Streptomyces sp. NPDC005388 TaxID=3156717 RepID=UPI0033B4B58F